MNRNIELPFGSIRLNEETLKFAALKRIRDFRSKKIATLFINQTFDICHDVESIITESSSILLPHIINEVDVYVKALVTKGIYTINRELFFENYVSMGGYDFHNVIDSLEANYAEIIMTEENLNEYRRSRREGRGRVIGGGSSFESALKGVVTASAINITTGLLHGIFNLGASAISNQKKETEIKKLYNSSSLKCMMFESVIKSINSITDTYLKIHEDSLGRIYASEPTDIDCKKSKAITDNIEREIIHPVDHGSMLLKAIELNPFNAEAYKLSIGIFGDADGRIEKASKYFVGSEIERYKLELVKNKHAELTKQAKTEVEHINALEKLRETCREIDFDANNKYTIRIENWIKKYDLNERTVEGVTFDSREYAKAQRDAICSANKIIKNHDHNNIKSIQRAIEKLSDIELDHKLKITYLDEKIMGMREKIDEMDVKCRTVNDTLYSSIEIADEIRKSIEECNRILCETDKNNKDSLVEAMSSISAVNHYPELEKLFIPELKDNLEKLDLKERTFRGVEFKDLEEKKIQELKYEELINKKEHIVWDDISSMLNWEQTLINSDLENNLKKDELSFVSEKIKARKCLLAGELLAGLGIERAPERKGGCFYAQPNMDLRKLSNFHKEHREIKGTPLIYFDETTFGTGDKGILVTDEAVIINIKSEKRTFALEDVKCINKPSLFGTSISVTLNNGEQLSYDTSQSIEKDLEIFCKSVNKYIGHRGRIEQERQNQIAKERQKKNNNEELSQLTTNKMANIEDDIDARAKNKTENQGNERVVRKKRKWLLVLATLVGGSIGLHKFYSGTWAWGIIYIISCFFLPGLSFGISLLETLRLIFISRDSFNKKYNSIKPSPISFIW